ncbi:hypothetical protein SDC9_73278 [bioreactor metagenome]|uniref:Uncharacterized protein n=1 Tax=bioreactor metagenome TaxID=1076179 RepID=A0A644YJU5_9ZZZZ
MISSGRKRFRYLSSAVMQRLIVLMTMPVLATACSVPEKAQNTSMAADTTRQLVVNVPEPPDTMQEIKVDSIVPVYECPVTVTPCYGVVATPIIQESIEVNFEIPELYNE